MTSKMEAFLYTVFSILVVGFVYQFTVFYLLSEDFSLDLRGAPGSRSKLASRGEQFSEQLLEAQNLLVESQRIGKNLKKILYYLREQSTQQSMNLHLKLKILERLQKAPKRQYEYLHRRIYRNIQNFRSFLNYEKVVIEVDFQNNSFRFPDTSHYMDEIMHSLLFDMRRLKAVDGYNNWRRTEMKQLSESVQSQINSLQNPSDCSTAKKLVCSHRFCGFSCLTHHLVNCLSYALGTQRTFVLQPTKYENYDVDFVQVFQPISESCTSVNMSEAVDYPTKNSREVQTLKLWTTYAGTPGLSHRPKFFPRAVPQDLHKRISRIHDSPSAWWTGQLVKYVMESQPDTQNFLDQEMTRLNFYKPIVGIHIRRTDKLTDESPELFQALEEYMTKVDEYFKFRELYEGDVDKRRVFIATDDTKVLKEAARKYPNYEIISNYQGAMRAEKENLRYTKPAFYGILLDIYLLSRSDFIVCTFSSEVCRLAYELMQTRHVDASKQFASLDYIYYYNEQRPQYYRAVLDHKARDNTEFSFKRGEIIEQVLQMTDNLGLFSAIKNDTRRKGMIPRFKVEELVERVPFTTSFLEPHQEEIMKIMEKNVNSING